MHRGLKACALIWLSGCAGTPIEPMKDHQDARQLSPEERRLWHDAVEFDQQLQIAGSLYQDAELQGYLERVMQRLYPEYQGAVGVGVIDSPSLNAFALPNGSIYINTGMLTRLDNEAQLATILAHEGIHFTHKHGWQQRRNVKQSTAFSTGFTVVTGIPLLGDLVSISSIYGFSKEMEREADAEGFKRLEAAGYDVTQAPLTFEFLLAEVTALDIDEPYVFSTHPRLRERIESFDELVQARKNTGGYRGEQAYHAHIGRLQLKLLEDYLQLGRFQSVLLILGRAGAFDRYPPAASFYLGEAYRLRGDEGDSERALAAYRTALERAPDFAPSYRAIGLHHMKNDQPQLAEQFLERYLQLRPDAPDRGYIEHYRSSLPLKRSDP